MMHELYKDVRAAGVGEKTNGRIYGTDHLAVLKILG